MFLVLPLSHENFNPKRFTISILKFTVSIPNHTHKQQATSHNSSRFLFYGQPDKAQVSSRVYVWPATDGWSAMVWCSTGTDQFVCCLGQSPWRNSSYVRNMEQWYKPVLCKHRGRHTFWNVNILPSLGLLCYTDGQNNRGHSYSQIYE